MRKKVEHKGPVTTIIIVTFIAMIITSILSSIGLEGQQTEIVNGRLETFLITTKNIFSLEGIKFLCIDSIVNFINFEPIAYLLISLIGISIAESSGLMDSLVSKIKRLKLKYLTIFVMVISMLSLFLGNYAYVYLLPVVAIIYKKIGKNPLLGIMTVFISLTLGHGLGFFYDYNDYYLGIMTQLSARVDVDKTYTFGLLSNLYITIFSTIALIMLCANLIENKLALKLNNPVVHEEEKTFSKRAEKYSFLTFLGLLSIVILGIIPKINYLGFLLDKTETTYIAQLFGPKSPFGNGFLYIVTIILMSSSYIYGKISGNIKNSHEYNEGLSASFSRTGYIFVIMLFISTLIGIIEWTNIGNVLTANLLDFMSGVEFSGIPLILTSFIIIIIVTIFIPSSIDKWVLFSPIIVPLFMRSNITPNYTQFMFSVADGIGKSLTPLFPYYILMLGLMYKYNEKDQISLFSPMRLMMPIILITALVLILIVIGWFLIGLPLGIDTFSTL